MWRRLLKNQPPIWTTLLMMNLAKLEVDIVKYPAEKHPENCQTKRADALPTLKTTELEFQSGKNLKP